MRKAPRRLQGIAIGASASVVVGSIADVACQVQSPEVIGRPPRTPPTGIDVVTTSRPGTDGSRW